MSGLEIAGVVLGCLPLLITALEHYGDGVRTIQKWRKYERELHSVVRNLKTERVKLQNVCETLLDGLVPPSWIDRMVEDPGGELWQEKETQRKIRTRLWRSWGVFEQTVNEMKAAIDETMEKLGTGAKTKWTDSSSVVRELKRAAFTLNRSSYNDLLSTIKDGVASLETLTKGSIDLEPKRRVRSHVRFLSILRGLSSSMYRAVRSSLACACKHKVLMRLSTWPAEITPVDADEEIIRDLKFRLALSSESVRSAPSESQALMENLHSWEEILLQANAAPQTRADHPVPAVKRALEDCSSGPGAKRRKTVNFASFRTSSTNTTSTATLLQGERTMISDVMSKMTLKVTSVALSSFGSSLNLCGELRQMSMQRKVDCYGMVFDPETSKPARSYSVYPVSGLLSDKSQIWKVVSLRDVLEGKDGLVPLGYRQRLQLAVFIARSILQLFKTPWLPETPGSRNIFFIQHETSKFSYYEHAFVMAESSDHSVESGETSAVLSIIRCPALLALGVLLIELMYNQTIESLSSPEESSTRSGGHHLLSDYMTARRLLEQVNQGSSNYGSAVRRCINGEFSTRELDLEDEDFRQEVYSSVVALLEEDLSHA